MPGTIPNSVTDVANMAATKAESLRELPRYVATTMLAGAGVGAAVVLSARTAGPLSAGALGLALTLIAFAGAELFTFNTAIMALGWLRGHVSPGEAILVNLVSLVGNVVGAIGFSAMVHGSGVLPAHATISTPHGPLFWRAVVCSMLVCVALWMATRDSATHVVLFWAVFAFVAAGVEHPIANVTIFALAIFQGTAQWSALGHDLLLTVPGMIVGGAVLLALPHLPMAETAQY